MSNKILWVVVTVKKSCFLKLIEKKKKEINMLNLFCQKTLTVLDDNTSVLNILAEKYILFQKKEHQKYY